MSLKMITLPLIFAAYRAGSMWLAAAEQPKIAVTTRCVSEGGYAAGNYKAAYDGFLQAGFIDPKMTPARVSGDMQTAITTLQRLGRTDEIDEFREAVIETHKRKLAASRLMRRRALI